MKENHEEMKKNLKKLKEEEFISLREEAKEYKYNSFTYLEYENIKDFGLLIRNREIILIYGKDEEEDFYQVYWAANEAGILAQEVNNLEIPAIVSFIPKEWREYLSTMGFGDHAAFRDYYIPDLSAWKNGEGKSEEGKSGEGKSEEGYSREEYSREDFSEANFSGENISGENISGENISGENISLLTEEDCYEASEVTISCRWQSRGFKGETEEWFKAWINGEDPNAVSCGSEICNVVIHKEKDKIVGVACIAVYGYESSKGPVLWLREIAVRPEFQGRGIGKKLICQSIRYGKGKGAKRAFLMADDCNEAAVHLYKSVGFIPGEDSEIWMLSGKGNVKC